MRAISTLRPNNAQAGFTLVEVLVVAPIVILIIGALVAAIVALTSNALMAQGKNEMTQASQNAFQDIESAVGSSATILNSADNLTTPQGKNNTASALESNSSTLILSSPALTKNALDEDRLPVHYQNRPHACNDDKRNANEAVHVITVFFMDGTDLKKRTILPEDIDEACSESWQENTCASGQTASICTADDRTLTSFLTDDGFTVEYLLNGSPITSSQQPQEADAIRLSITSERKAAGKTVTAKSRLDIPVR